MGLVVAVLRIQPREGVAGERGSFSKMFTPEAIIGFLVFGPILDFKNTFVMMASFRIKFVLLFILIVTIVVFILSLVSGLFLA